MVTKRSAQLVAHDEWEAARQKRNEAATRVIWRAHGMRPGQSGHPDDPDVAKYLAEFYHWDAEMDRISAAIDEMKAADAGDGV